MQVKPRRPVLNWGHPLARGLIGAWPLAERGGTMTQDLCRSATGRTDPAAYVPGTLRNMEPASDWIVSGPGPCLRFYGASTGNYNTEEQVHCGNVCDRTGTLPWTLAVWFRVIFGGSAFYFLAGRGASTGLAANRELGLFYNGNGSTNTLFFNRHDGLGGSETLTSVSAYARDAWHHAVLTYDSATMRLYVNGRFDNSVASTRSVLGTDYFMIGNWTQGGGTSYPLYGDIADVRVWSRPLTAREVASLYARPWDMYRVAGPMLGKVPSAAAPTTKPFYFRRFIASRRAA